MNHSQTLFGDTKKDNKHKKSAPERMLMMVFRNDYYPAIVKKLQETMGNDYTDEAAEEVFKSFVMMQKDKGTFQAILDQYLQEKIKSEREKFLGSSRAQL